MQPLANITPLKLVPRSGAIQVDRVGQTYRSAGQDVVALSDVSFEIKPGRFTVLVGPSGCGKSSLLMMMAGLRRPTSGTILVSGAPIDNPDPNRVGVVFQEPSLFPGSRPKTMWNFHWRCEACLRRIAAPRRRRR